MGHLSIFDIAGPVMVGPSSSHTAGACKIGQFARALFHATPTKVTFYLHGSFGEVYKGHATDRALLGGVMKFQTSDPRIKTSFEIADQQKLAYKFIPKELGDEYHPNTVEIMLENKQKKMSVIGCSVGGGMIEIVKIDNFKVKLKGTAGKYLSLVVAHRGKKALDKVIEQIRALGIEIVEENHSKFNDEVLTILSLDGRRILLNEVVELEKTPGVDFIRSLSKLQTQ